MPVPCVKPIDMCPEGIFRVKHASPLHTEPTKAMHYRLLEAALGLNSQWFWGALPHEPTERTVALTLTCSSKTACFITC